MNGKTDRKKRWAVLLLSLVYAFFYTMLTAEHFLSAAAFGRFGISFCVLLVILGYLSGLSFTGMHGEKKEPVYRLGERQFFLAVWGIFAAFEFILWLSLFPGIFGYDSYKQMAFYTGAEVWSTHHPVFHTWLLGTILRIGQAVFGSFNAGVALYTFLQMLLISSAYAYTLLFLRRRRLPIWVLMAAAVYFLIHPTIQLLNFNTTKDTLFGVCFLYFLIFMLMLLEGDTRRSVFALFIVSGLFSCLLRNQGVYVMAVLILMFLLMLGWEYRSRKRYARTEVTEKETGNDPEAADNEATCDPEATGKEAACDPEIAGQSGCKTCRGCQMKKILIGLLAICAVTKLFDLTCTGVFHLAKGEVREMLSVPMQQTAAVLIADRNGDALIDDEQRMIASTLVSDEALSVYEEDTADPVKGLFPSAQFQACRGVYIKNYLTVGLQNHGIYTDAWLAMIRPYWDMSRAKYHALMAEYTGNCEADYGICERPVIPFVGRVLKALAIHDDYRLIPGVSHLFDPGVYIWVVITVFIIAAVYRKRVAVIACIPGLLYFCTLLLGPVALVRYLYPLLLTLPVVPGMLHKPARETENET